MADFKKAIRLLLNHEGGFSNDSNDPGGATNYGISLRFLKTLGQFGDFDGDGDVDVDDIKIIDIDRASFIYQKEWWNLFRYNLIKDDDIAAKILDWSVNMGAVRAHMLIQRALNILPIDNKEYLKIDGVFGTKTIDAINRSNPMRLMIALRGVLCSYYIDITEKNSNNEKYIIGWLNKKAFDEKFPID